MDYADIDMKRAHNRRLTRPRPRTAARPRDSLLIGPEDDEYANDGMSGTTQATATTGSFQNIRAALMVISFFVVLALIGGWVGFGWANDSKSRVHALGKDLVELNETLCAKVVILSEKVEEEFDMINTILNMTNSDLMDVLTNSSAKFMTIMAQIAQLEDPNVNQFRVTGNCTGLGAIASIDSMGGVVCSTMNADIGDLNDVDTTGVTVNEVLVFNGVEWTPEQAVLMIEGVTPATSGNVDMVGTGGIIIDTNAGLNQVIIDGSTLEIAINNLDLLTSTHSMEINDLQDKDMVIMDQIEALNITAQMIIEGVNGSQIILNMTIEDLLMDVAMLKMQVAELENSTVETGTLLPWAGTAANIPDGFLFCDGTVYEQVDYPDLFTVIGTAYCLPLACTGSQFAVPDMRGNVPVGTKFNTTNFGVRGTVTGDAEHVLSEAEMPLHNHGVSGTTDNAGTHQHITQMSYTDANSFTVDIMDGANEIANGCVNSGIGCKSIFTDDATTGYPFGFGLSLRYLSEPAGFHNHFFSTNSAGAGMSTAHNNVQPSVVVGGYIIRK